MQAFIGAKLLSSKVAQPTKKPFEIYDSRLRLPTAHATYQLPEATGTRVDATDLF
jgi:hypothetical protein